MFGRKELLHIGGYLQVKSQGDNLRLRISRLQDRMRPADILSS